MRRQDPCSFVRAAFAVAAGLVLSAAPALAQDAPQPPSAEQIRSAGDEYDAGRRGYLAKDYEGAAIHFENAFRDAPSAEALRNAIRSRKEARQYSRAATLAALAQAQYPKDAATQAVAKDALKDSAGKLHKVTLSCDPRCAVAADGRLISLTDAVGTVFYLDPGGHDVVISWSDNRNQTKRVDARAGGYDELTLTAPPKPAPPVVAPPLPPLPVEDRDKDNPKPVPDETPPSRKPFGPAVFVTGVVLTVAAGGVAIWSGLDAQNNPGPDAVKRDCVGQGTSCPEYQKGVSAQNRTNIVLAVGGGLAVLTAVVGIFLTQWSHPKPEPLGLRSLTPSVGLAPGVRGEGTGPAVFGLRGVF